MCSTYLYHTYYLHHYTNFHKNLNRIGNKIKFVELQSLYDKPDHGTVKIARPKKLKTYGIGCVPAFTPLKSSVSTKSGELENPYA